MVIKGIDVAVEREIVNKQFWKPNSMAGVPSYKISALGDSAIIIDFGNVISEKLNDLALSLFHQLQRNPIAGITEAVPAYSSLAVYYDVTAIRKKTSAGETAFEWIRRAIENFIQETPRAPVAAGAVVTIPVCYEEKYGTDIAWIAEQNNISPNEIIRYHTSKAYRVYMLGFLPGFAYMGEVDESLISRRKQQPTQVEAGAVGIAGRQTGIYPLNSQGGWRIIGRTPLKLFDKNSTPPALLKAGDTVKFIPITGDEFENIKSRNP